MKISTFRDGAFKFITTQLFDLHPNIYYKPILLTKKELTNHNLVIQHFFDDYHLIEVRKHFHNLLEVAITRINELHNRASEKDYILYFIKKLEKKNGGYLSIKQYTAFKFIVCQ